LGLKENKAAEAYVRTRYRV